MSAYPHRLVEKIRKGESIPAPMAALLSAATPIFRAGMWARRRRSRVRVNARVISFGNVTAGGAGKTPAVIERARIELASGHRVAVLTRGYGGKRVKTPVAVTSDTPTHDLYEMVGDEPAMIVRAAPGVVVVKCPDRVAGAQVAIDEFACDTLLLDDGFQYVRLERDEDIVVINAANPFGSGHLLPRGILREPIDALRRATHFILTHCDRACGLDGLLDTLVRLRPGALIRQTRHAPKHVVRIASGDQHPLEYLRGKSVNAVCGIANPESFFDTLESLGAVIATRTALPDHGSIPAAALASEGEIVMTAKDAVRLASPQPNVLALHVELEDYPQPAFDRLSQEVSNRNPAEADS